MASDHMDKKEKEILEFIARAEHEFHNHRIWKELQCTPEKFFKAVKHHADCLNLSKEQWNKAYSKAKQASRIRSLEKQQPRQSWQTRNMGAIRA